MTSEFKISFESIADIQAMHRQGAYEYVVHGCNAQAVMGSGVAATLRAAYPIIYDPYAAHCRMHNFSRTALGTFCEVKVEPFASVVNLITQEHFGKQSCRYVDYEAIYNGFKHIRTLVDSSSHSRIGIHFPLIGAGLAHGDWSIISQCIKSAWEHESHPSSWDEIELILHLQP